MVADGSSLRDRPEPVGACSLAPQKAAREFGVCARQYAHEFHLQSADRAITRRDEIWEVSVGPYVENHFSWTDWMRTVIGAR